MRIEQARSTHLDDITRLALKLWPEQEGMGLLSPMPHLIGTQNELQKCSLTSVLFLIYRPWNVKVQLVLGHSAEKRKIGRNILHFCSQRAQKVPFSLKSTVLLHLAPGG
ncbi:hypothetical protein [Paenibacillus rubinfantis]|uniref:hypothetical protein n=1 Tax=Paenibacillus rubinfantis TaxID=1720296 RepID=UPI0011DD5A6A|nr:hypothetical protein [Paenibacillus rubinfantis]